MSDNNYGLKTMPSHQQQEMLLELAVLNAQQDLIIKQQVLISQQIINLEKKLKAEGVL
jgi:hypothetical protein